MLQSAINAVAEFHTAKNIDFKQQLGELAPRNDFPQLIVIMKQHSEAALRQFKTFMSASPSVADYRLLRIHLILEEISELIEAIMMCDEVETLDGIADAIYVLVGSAITMELPLSEAYAAVHESNMKKAASKGADNPRLHDKGSEWLPPNLAEIITNHRNGAAKAYVSRST